MELTDQMPFIDHCCQILPLMYNNVNVHLQEILGIGTIQKTYCLWGNAVILIG